MRYFMRVYTVCKGKKDLQAKKNTIFFTNNNLTPLDIYNGPSQVYCIKPEGRIGSAVVECLTRDRKAVGSSLTSVTALWSLSKTHLS